MCGTCNMTKTFNSKSLTIDLSNDVDNIICDMLKEDKVSWADDFNPENMIKCIACEYEDIDNVWNFKKICCACNNKICLTCFKDGEEDDSNLDYIVNYNNCDDVDEWLCVDCGHCCEKCDEYTDEYSIYALLDVEGDYIYCCRGCIINEGMDMVRTVDNNLIRYMRNEYEGSEHIHCVDCGFENYELEFIGDNEDDEDKHDEDELDDEEKFETGLYERVLKDNGTNQETFYNFYDEEEDCVNICCGDCGDITLRY